jgi:hypothetical protein
MNVVTHCTVSKFGVIVVCFATVGYFLSLFLYYFDLHHLLILSVEGYCCILTDTHTHTHTHILGRTSLSEGSAPWNAQHSLEKFCTTGRIRTRTASNQAASDLRLRPRAATRIGACAVTSLKMTVWGGIYNSEMNIAIEQRKAMYVLFNHIRT